MTKHFYASAFGVLALGFATAAQTAPLSDAEYSAGKDRIAQGYKADRQKCDALSGNTKDICIAQAKGDEKRAKAKLELDRQPDTKRQYAYAEASAEADYEVAKEKCDALSGNAKDVCMKEAQAARTKMLADAKAARDTKSARADASAEKQQADYKLAIERCDALAGAAKEQCVNDARSKFGK
jgi:hypothetical protein